MTNNKERDRPPLKIESEKEFLSLMEEIDHQMVTDKVKISSRILMAGLYITKQYNVSLSVISPNRLPKKDCFDSIELSIRIQKWVKDRYGEKTRISFNVGNVVLPIRGALYTVNCPTVYGTVKFICDPNTMGNKKTQIGKHRPPTSNILDLIQDLTINLAKSLNAAEIVKITVAFIIGMKAYMNLQAISELDYVNEAKGDLDAAVSHLVSNRQQPGLSKWASLQAVEKLIKTYISQKGEKVKRIHSLSILFKQAEELGLIAPPQMYIDDVQCSAGVRYGEISVSVEDAVKAHLVSLEICEATAQSIGKLLNQNMPVVPEPFLDGIPMSQFLNKYMT